MMLINARFIFAGEGSNAFGDLTLSSTTSEGDTYLTQLANS